jgi:hypothetical protein
VIGPEEYRFWIDAYSPESIPMGRLAAYMQKLANLLGQEERVHFVKLEGGSTSVVHVIEREAAPKVRQRISQVTTDDAPEDARRAYRELNDMLRSDNAIGRLVGDYSNVLFFPGREIQKPPRIGPFKQRFELEGVLVRVGGKDKSAHATLEDGEGNTWSCEITRPLAKEMAHFLFGKPLRVSGTARWERTEDGEWHLDGIKGESFIELSDMGLESAIADLRAMGTEFKPGMQELIRQLRSDDGEVH